MPLCQGFASWLPGRQRPSRPSRHPAVRREVAALRLAGAAQAAVLTTKGRWPEERAKAGESESESWASKGRGAEEHLLELRRQAATDALLLFLVQSEEEKHGEAGDVDYPLLRGPGDVV